MAAPLHAQTAPITSGATDPYANQNLNDLWNNRSGQGASSIFSLINQLQLSGGRSVGDFSSEQEEGFQSAVSEFRKRQLEKLQTPAGGTSQPTTATPSQPTTP